MVTANGMVGEVDILDRIEERSNSPQDQRMTDQPNEHAQPDKVNKSTQASEESTASRPALKREYTPPHRIRIWNGKAWRLEHSYSNVHDHITKILNRVRRLPLPALAGLPSLA